MNPRIWVLLFFAITQLKADYIANDVVNNYAHVKELLREFYRKHERRENHDMDPTQYKIISENLDQAVKSYKTEAVVNRKLWTELFENDIILTLNQAEELLKESNGQPRLKRQAHPDPRNFWPNLTISYEFYGGEEKWRQMIRSSLRHVEKETCFKFLENGPDRDGLRYFRGSGCWSNVGRIGGRQLVSIGYGCDSLGIVSHETLHALGLWHEQSRTDRDDFIRIVSNKITRGTEGNFAKRTKTSSDNLGQPYDLGSVMHYGSKAFSYDWTSETILTKDKNYQNTIGQRDGLSFKDAKIINKRYCSNVCTRKLPCLNSGYTDPNNCNRCRCPTGYGGTFCERVQYTYCGGTYLSSANLKSIASGYLQPNAHCIWHLKNPGGQIAVYFDEVNFPCTDPCQSYIEVKSAADKTATGARLCCGAPDVIKSEAEDIILIYKVQSNIVTGWRGFNLKFKNIYQYPLPPPTTFLQTTVTVPSPSTSPPELSAWGLWGEWSSCSQPCGGCGTRTRLRACYGGERKCSGTNVESGSCNTHLCQKPAKGMICNGRILIPCDLISKLKFGSNNFLNPKYDTQYSKEHSLPLPRDPSKFTNAREDQKIVVRKKRNQTIRFCEKKFLYQCPTNLLTINIEYKNENSLTRDAYFNEYPECCEGYVPDGNICVQRQTN